MIEPEIAFADLEDDMILAESMLKYIINYVFRAMHRKRWHSSTTSSIKGLLERLYSMLQTLSSARVTYTEAVEILEKTQRQI